MPKLKLELLKPGMVVAAAVKNLDGMLLVPSGCELSERHINILETWGVNEVDVEAAEEAHGPVDPLSLIPPARLAEITAEVKGVFWQLDPADTVQQEVFRVMLARRAKHEVDHR